MRPASCWALALSVVSKTNALRMIFFMFLKLNLNCWLFCWTVAKVCKNSKIRSKNFRKIWAYMTKMCCKKHGCPIPQEVLDTCIFIDKHPSIFRLFENAFASVRNTLFLRRFCSSLIISVFGKTLLCIQFVRLRLYIERHPERALNTRRKRLRRVAAKA